MFETAFAKVNLALHVRARQADGYHSIETLFAFVEDGDCLSVLPSEHLSLSITGPFGGQLGGGEGNLVLRAAEALRNACGVAAGAVLQLDKRLPVAAGLGGGSADAAAALRLLARWWGLGCSPSDLEEIGRGLGADVAACVRSILSRGEGRGDRLSPIHDPLLSETPILIINPLVPVPTSSVFAGWDGQDRGPLGQGPALSVARAGRNDLEQSAIAIAPVVAEVLDILARSGDPQLVRMSGSGASCFALYSSEEARDAAAADLAGSHPHWWQLATRIRHNEEKPHD